MRSNVVDFEDAKILKASGFSELTQNYYWQNGSYNINFYFKNERYMLFSPYVDFNSYEEYYSAPFYVDVIKWFENKKKILVKVEPYDETTWMYSSVDLNGEQVQLYPVSGPFETYEEAHILACKEAIKRFLVKE